LDDREEAMRLLRLDDNLTLVPANVAAVEIVPRFESYEISPMTFRPVQCGHNVIVHYLMVAQPHIVASFGPGTTRDHPGFMSKPLYDNDTLATMLVESEARARVVYETILEAIRQER
jgi:hypothetical protein